MYFLSSSLLRWITSERMPKATAIFAAIMIFPMIICYVVLLLYLTFKPETPATNPLEFILSSGGSSEIESTREDDHGIQKAMDIQMSNI